MTAKNRKFLIPFCYLVLYIVWGATYFFTKMAVETIPPFYVVGGRFIIGGPLLLFLALLSGQIKQRPTRKELGASLLLGALLLIGGSGLITISEKHIDSYVAALIVTCTPMVVAFYDRVLLKKRISAIRLSGILIGITGVALLLYNGQSFFTSFSPHVLMAISGVALWSLASSLGREFKTYPNPIVNSGIQMLFVGLVCLVGVSFFPPSPAEFLPTVSVRSASALTFLAIIGSLAFAAFTYLLANEPAIRVVSYALVNPVIATLLGLLVGNETAAPLLALSLPLVLIGVALMLYGETMIKSLKTRRTKCVTVTIDCPHKKTEGTHRS